MFIDCKWVDTRWQWSFSMLQYARTMEVNYLDLVREGYMWSMQWQLGREMGTIPAFASRTQENQENLGRDGRSQDLPDSGF